MQETGFLRVPCRWAVALPRSCQAVLRAPWDLFEVRTSRRWASAPPRSCRGVLRAKWDLFEKRNREERAEGRLRGQRPAGGLPAPSSRTCSIR